MEVAQEKLIEAIRHPLTPSSARPEFLEFLVPNRRYKCGRKHDSGSLVSPRGLFHHGPSLLTTFAAESLFRCGLAAPRGAASSRKSRRPGTSGRSTKSSPLKLRRSGATPREVVSRPEAEYWGGASVEEGASLGARWGEARLRPASVFDDGSASQQGRILIRNRQTEG